MFIFAKQLGRYNYLEDITASRHRAKLHRLQPPSCSISKGRNEVGFPKVLFTKAVGWATLSFTMFLSSTSSAFSQSCCIFETSCSLPNLAAMLLWVQRLWKGKEERQAERWKENFLVWTSFPKETTEGNKRSEGPLTVQHFKMMSSQRKEEKGAAFVPSVAMNSSHLGFAVQGSLYHTSQGQAQRTQRQQLEISVRTPGVNDAQSLLSLFSLSLCISYAELICSCTAKFYPGKKPQKYVSATAILPFVIGEENAYEICLRALWCCILKCISLHAMEAGTSKPID